MDVRTIRFLIKIQIECIYILYVVESTDLNQDSFNTSIDYHVISQYGPLMDLQRFSSKLGRPNFII